VQDKQKVLLSEIVAKVNDLFDGELSDDDRLVYVNHVKGKLLESDILVQQASNNSKGQFDNSPDLDSALTDAIIDAFDAYTTMSKQALDSERVRSGLKAILLGPAQLYEALRERGMCLPPEARHYGAYPIRSLGAGSFLCRSCMTSSAFLSASYCSRFPCPRPASQLVATPPMSAIHQVCVTTMATLPMPAETPALAER
jgi:hypothetical protein